VVGRIETIERELGRCRGRARATVGNRSQPSAP